MVGEGRTWKHHIDHLELLDLPTPENSAAEEPPVVMDTLEIVHLEAVHQEIPQMSEAQLQDGIAASGNIPIQNAMPTTTALSGTRSQPTTTTQQSRRGSTSSRQLLY